MRNGVRVSLYYKLFLIFGVTFLLILVALIPSVSHLMDDPGPERTLKLIRLAAPNWASQIGAPPDSDVVKKLEHEYKIKIVIHDLSTKHDESIPALRKSYDVERVSFKGLEYFFQPESLREAVDTYRDFRIYALEMLACYIVILLSSLAVRRILKPIRMLTAAAQQYGSGDLAARAHVRTRDEIGGLADTFDTMADRIQSQLEALKQMAIGVSHEIRSPLARMRLATERVKDESVKVILNEQLSEIDQVTGAILEREALNSGLSSLQLTNVDVGDLLSELVEHFKASGHSLGLVVPDKPVESHLDRRRIEMCIKNVIDNSLKHAAADKPMQIRVVTEHGIEIQIQDFGGGFKSEKSSGGFGVGLMLSRSIARAHGGDLIIESAAGSGTLIRIQFREKKP